MQFRVTPPSPFLFLLLLPVLFHPLVSTGGMVGPLLLSFKPQLSHTPRGHAKLVHGVASDGRANNAVGSVRIRGLPRRHLRQDPSEAIPVNITEPENFEYLGEIVEESTPKIMSKDYVDVSPDNTAVFYVEKEPNNWTSYVVMRAILSGSATLAAAGKGKLSWTISRVAGPFTNVSGLLVLDESSLLLSFRSENLVRKHNATSGEELSSMSVREPYSMAKHQSEETVFVASNDSIIALPLMLPERQQTLAGSGHNSSGAGTRFLHPNIGPDSLSSDGSHLYVADEDNHIIRRVNAVTGATETIAGQEGNASSSDGPLSDAGFSFPKCPALTIGGTNLFLVDQAAGIRRLTFDRSNGSVSSVSTILKSNQSTGYIAFSKDNRLLFFAAGSHVFVLRVNLFEQAFGISNRKSVSLMVVILVQALILGAAMLGLIFLAVRTLRVAELVIKQRPETSRYSDARGDPPINLNTGYRQNHQSYPNAGDGPTINLDNDDAPNPESHLNAQSTTPGPTIPPPGVRSDSSAVRQPERNDVLGRAPRGRSGWFRSKITEAVPFNITDPDLVRYVSEVAPESTPKKIMLKQYIGLSPNDTTLFYVEKEPGNWTSYVLMRAIRSGSVGGACSPIETNISWTISQVAGPFTNVSGLLVLDESSLLLSFRSENLVRKLNATSGEELSSMSVREPYSMAKHPREETVFVASNDSIVSLPLTFPANQRTLAGPSVVVNEKENRSSADNSTGAGVRFLHPSIGPHAVSPNGSHLYVADEGHHIIRRVNTVTGATETIAGQEGNASSSDGRPFNATFSFPRCPELTQGSNFPDLVLVDQSGIRWLTVDFGDRVIGVRTIVKSTQSTGCIIVSHDNNLLFFAADSHVFVLEDA
ncbi:hypothetical protein CBR_g696 [Chara braunii]|uniref:Strictosidine synthase conserved region domain-containing protein n=1 Tax=Chara braunii TaxID=69332 RepID=A0A388KC22_CHABU|nr:hypothetical protein CBR_g696 [Chara braunii]|eukprot:GBG67567.1 hypothetical protein CBR_g696 [Chara braunii]